VPAWRTWRCSRRFVLSTRWSRNGDGTYELTERQGRDRHGRCDQYRRPRSVRAFHAVGARVVIADIDDEPGAALAENWAVELPSSTAPILPDDAQIDSCVAATVGDFGGVDILIKQRLHHVRQGTAVEP